MDSSVPLRAGGRDQEPPQATAARRSEIRELGPLEVFSDGAQLNLGGGKQKAVFALIALSGPRGVSLDRLIDGVWGDSPPEAASASVYSYVSNLRVILDGGVARRSNLYLLDSEFSSDAREFESAVERARSAVDTNPRQAAEALRSALATWRGLPYADLLEVPGLQDEIRRLEELRLDAVELRMEAEVNSGHAADLVGELEALVKDHPFRERFRALLMVALYRSGRQAEALRVYQHARTFLAEELGLDPSPELQELELRILQQDDALTVTPGQAVTRRASFLFTDIEGSIRHWDEHPDAMAIALARHDDIVRDAVEESGGTVFKHTGDGALCVFSDTEAAAKAAEAVQRALHDSDWGSVGGLSVRMAIDAGDVDVRDGGYYGPPLNRCSRILAAGHGGQVLLSSTASNDLSRGHLPGVQIRQLGPKRLKGLVEPERIAQLVFVGLLADFPDLRTEAVIVSLDARLTLGGLPGFELRERIGAGQYGTVYRAFQPSVGREVAVRVISPEYSNHPMFVRRFEVEVRTIAKLEHPHIVPVHDFWRDSEGAYVIMQLLRGGSLRDAMSGAPWDPAPVAKLFRHVGSALAHAHGEGAFHRDLRPENVLLDGTGNAYLSDFGIASRLFDPLLEGRGEFDNVRYRAPEQRRGNDADRRADIFSLGVLAFELLSGSSAPESEPLPTMGSLGIDLPARTDAVLARAVAHSPLDRYPEVAAFVNDLEEALEIGDLAEPATVRTAQRNPYKGLRPFSEDDSPDFHGRDELVRTLLEAVERHRLITVVGPSGSGKSSAVHAGLVPRLRAGQLSGSDEWIVLSMTPGSDPVSNLAEGLGSVATRPLGDVVGRLESSPAGLAELVEEVLPPGDTELILIVDQFEELFTLSRESDRNRLIELLAQGAGEEVRLRLVLVLRADFYDRPLQNAELARLVANGLVTVVPPTLEELIRAIEQPALAVGLSFEPGLPMRIARDVVDQPGSLPLLQYALTQIVEQRGGDLLNSADYEAVGTVDGAVARRADAVFMSLSESDREIARQVLMRLVSVGEEVEDTRRRVRLKELESLGANRAAVTKVLETFGASRLLSFDREPVTRGPTVELSHEALLREWSRLKSWVEEEREGLILTRRLRFALAEWEESGGNDDYLLIGDRLSPFRQLDRSSALARDEREFLERCVAADEAARTARRRRRRAVVAGISSAAVVATLLAVAAFVQGERADLEAARAVTLAEQEAEARAEAEQQQALAEQQADIAEKRTQQALDAEALATARELAASAIGVGEEDPQLAMLLALEAFEIAPGDRPTPPELTIALREAIHSNRLVDVLTVDPPGEDAPVDRRLTLWAPPSGEWLAVGSQTTGDLLMYDVDSLELRWSREGADLRSRFAWDSPGTLRQVAISPDGDFLLLGTESGFEVISADDGSTVESLEDPCPPSDAAWSPDGRLVALASWECPDIRVLEAWTWVEVHVVPLTSPELMANTISFAEGPTGDLLFVQELFSEQPARIIDTENFELVATFPRYIGALSRDGKTYFGLNYPRDPDPALYEVESGRVIDRLEGLTAIPWTLGAGFSADGRYVLIPTEGARIPVWDVTTGELVFQLPAGQRASAVFGSHDRVFSASADGTVKVWNVSSGDLGEINSAETGVSCTMRCAWASETIGAVGGYKLDPPETWVYSFDPTTGELGVGRTFSPGSWPWVGVLGDLGIVLVEADDSGSESLVLWDHRADSERVLVDCALGHVACAEDGTITSGGSSVDGSEYGLLATDGKFVAWTDAGTEVPSVHLAVPGEDAPPPFLMAFSDEWIVVRVSFDEYVVYDRTGARITEFAADVWIQFDPSGEVGVAYGFEGSLLAIDTSDWSVRELTRDLGEGIARGVGVSPRGDRVAVGVMDGFVRVFDLADGSLLDRIPIDAVSSVRWIDDTHFAVTNQAGLWTVITLDTDELRQMAASGLQRDFTTDECRTYRIARCGIPDD